eukprot:4472680-Alexandrium_andersonii.AAC.1
MPNLPTRFRRSELELRGSSRGAHSVACFAQIPNLPTKAGIDGPEVSFNAVARATTNLNLLRLRRLACMRAALLQPRPDAEDSLKFHCVAPHLEASASDRALNPTAEAKRGRVNR